MDHPEHTDVVVIGLGPGGEYAAGTLAEAGLHVTGIESRLVGGECPYYGCIPSKMMIRAANLIAETRRVPGMAGTSTVTPDWSPVALRIREEATDYWNDKVAADRFTGKGGHLVRGHGKITGPGEVTVSTEHGTRVLAARRGIVINCGTEPAIPPMPGLAGTPYWTNREIVQAEQVPESLIVLGGGAIGAELAQVFARFGAAVTVVEALPRLVSFEEPEASELIERIFTAEGIRVCTNAPAERVSHNGTHFTVHLGDSVITAERLLVCYRAPGGPGLARRRRRRPGPRGSHHTDRRVDARRGRRVGHRRRDREGRLHAHVHVPGGHRGARHPRPGRRTRRLPRGAAGHLHRPGDRQRRPDRGTGQGGRAARAHRRQPGALLGPGLDTQGRQRRLHQGHRGCRTVRAGRRELSRPLRG